MALVRFTPRALYWLVKISESNESKVMVTGPAFSTGEVSATSAHPGTSHRGEFLATETFSDIRI
jgi:hypothetical protein